MVVLVCIVSGALVGVVVFGDQLLQKQSAKLTDLKVQNAVVDAQALALAKAKKDIASYTALNNIAKQIVPQDKDQARAVREIVTIAEDTGVDIASITFPASNLGQAPAKVTTPEGGAAATPDTTTPAAPPVSQVKPVDGISGVYQLDITVNTTLTQPISYVQLIDFLGRLEQNRRTAQITNLTITPNPLDRSSLTFSLQLTIYIKP